MQPKLRLHSKNIEESKESEEMIRKLRKTTLSSFCWLAVAIRLYCRLVCFLLFCQHHQCGIYNCQLTHIVWFDGGTHNFRVHSDHFGVSVNSLAIPFSSLSQSLFRELLFLFWSLFCAHNAILILLSLNLCLYWHLVGWENRLRCFIIDEILFNVACISQLWPDLTSIRKELCMLSLLLFLLVPEDYFKLFGLLI